MGGSGNGDARNATESIGYNRRARRQVMLGPIRQYGFAKSDHGVHAHGNGMIGLVACYGRDKRRLAWTAAPTLAATALATPIGIIHLYRTAERPLSVALDHRLHQL